MQSQPCPCRSQLKPGSSNLPPSNRTTQARKSPTSASAPPMPRSDSSSPARTESEASKFQEARPGWTPQSSLRALLEDRFRLKVHTETKELQIFALTVAKNGPKLESSRGGDCFDPQAGVPPPPSPDSPVARSSTRPDSMAPGTLVSSGLRTMHRPQTERVRRFSQRRRNHQG